MPEGIPVHSHKLNYRILVRILGNKKERFSSQPGSRGTLVNTTKIIFLYYPSFQNAQRREILFIINRHMI